MNNFSSEITTEKELPQLAERLLEFAGGKKVFLFYGEMGSGKTTFIKVICEALGIQQGLSSPTYSIINEYHSRTGEKIFHFDLYRLRNFEEVLNLGMEDYLYSGNYCFVEWPEIAEPLHFENAVRVKIFPTESGRKIEVT